MSLSSTTSLSFIHKKHKPLRPILNKEKKQTFEQSLKRPKEEVIKDCKHNQFYKMKLSLMMQEIERQKPVSEILIDDDETNNNPSKKIFTMKQLRLRKKQSGQEVISKYKSILGLANDLQKSMQ